MTETSRQRRELVRRPIQRVARKFRGSEDRKEAALAAWINSLADENNAAEWHYPTRDAGAEVLFREDPAIIAEHHPAGRADAADPGPESFFATVAEQP